MMNTGIKLICAFAICCVSSLFVYWINLKRKNRKEHNSFPFISGGYSVIATIILLIYNNQIIEWINRIGLTSGEKLQKVNYIYSIDELVNTDIALFNLAIILIYVVIKLFSLLFVRLSKKKKERTKNKRQRK